MVKDVLNINELFVQFNELDGRLMGIVGSHLVCKPKLRYSHDEELIQTLNVCERGKFGSYGETSLGFYRISEDPCFAGKILIC